MKIPPPPHHLSRNGFQTHITHERTNGKPLSTHFLYPCSNFEVYLILYLPSLPFLCFTNILKNSTLFTPLQKTKCGSSLYATKSNSLIFKIPIYRRIFLANYPIFFPFLFCRIQQNPYICIAFEKIP